MQDVAWSPNCIDGRCYDYAALGSIADLVFVMAYDMRSQVCV
jgi:di-N-acetylchitobiase